MHARQSRVRSAPGVRRGGWSVPAWWRKLRLQGSEAPVPEPDLILRFQRSERLLHWAIAVPFLGCLLSALVLIVFYNRVLVIFNPDPQRTYRFVFAWIHRACGTGLLVFPSLVLLANVRQFAVFRYNLGQAWVWRWDDVKWLMLMGPATFSPRLVLPDQGKFNAAEKLNFMMVTVFSPLLILTGSLIWFPETTKLGSFAPWMVHCALVGIATPLLCGHMFMATVNPSTRVGLMGMVTGFVSREWASHHYTRWFREQFPHLVREHEPHDDAGASGEPEVSAAAWDVSAAEPECEGSAEDGDDLSCDDMAVPPGEEAVPSEAGQ